MQNYLNKIKQSIFSKKFLRTALLPFALAVAAAFVARYQLELSDGVTAGYLAGQWPLYAPLNAATALCLTLVIFALCGRWWAATGSAGLVFTVLALINYYTRDLHGSALMPQDVLNIATAAEVMGSYTLKITDTVVNIAALLLPVAAAAAAQWVLEKPKRRRKIGWGARGVRVGGCVLGVAAVMYIGYFGHNPIKPAATYGWAWQETYYTYGYLAGTIESAGLLLDPIVKPDAYSEDAAAAAAAKAADYQPAVTPVSEQDYPDVFLILSESLYDPSLVTDLQADAGYLSVWQNLPNSIKGHTVSPHVGGGTNSSEYQMLTANSLMLMPSITPFNWLNLHNANSLVSYFEDLGYATMAAHPYTKSNYRRSAAWLALGFDQTYFIEDFPTAEYYGSRPYQTDSASYRDMLALYDAMPQDKPRFTFLVSIQTHGDYDMNDAALDVVHAARDYGEYDAVVDEFLSCVYYSDAAIAELTELLTRRYAETGRRAIVAIAGDHAPSFIDHIADKDGVDGNTLQILERSTPYLIWANYPLENAGQTNPADPFNRMDLCDLGPTLVEAAGLPLTDYQRYILAMKQLVPVQTAGNDYMTADGATYTYGQDAALDEWVHGYFALEYNNIGTDAVRQQHLFELG